MQNIRLTSKINSLQVADVAFQKVHDARREYEAGEYGKETSDACV
jgi:hypothetical protein